MAMCSLLSAGGSDPGSGSGRDFTRYSGPFRNFAYDNDEDFKTDAENSR